MTLRQLRLEWHVYGGRSAWRRVHPCGNDERVFFDRRTGDFHWSFQELNDGEIVNLAIADFEEVPAPLPEVHRGIWEAFVQSLSPHVRNLHDVESPERFRTTAEQPLPSIVDLHPGYGAAEHDLWRQWELFESACLKRLATAWFRERGIEAKWVDWWTGDDPE